MRLPFSVISAVCLLMAGVGAPAKQPLLEYQVKAVAVVNVIRFATWPPSALPEPPAPIVIGIWGDNPFNGVLDEVAAAEKLAGRGVRVRMFGSRENPSGCNVVFICRSEQQRMRPVIDALHRQGVLTISEIEGFAQNGGIVGMSLVGGKLRFHVNTESARAAGLKLDSRFLSMAKLVR